MSFELHVAFSLSVGIGAVIGCIRFKKIDTTFLPFLSWLWAGFINELCSFLILKAGYSNIISYNLFSLFEALLLTWQFKRWNLFDNYQKKYYVIQLFFIAGWIAETIKRNNFAAVDSYFIIIYSGVLVLCSIDMLNKLMFNEPSALSRNAIFIICMGWVVYFTYAILVEAFWLYGLNKSKQFRVSIYEILAYINLLTNIGFAIATLWIPMKRRYILQL